MNISDDRDLEETKLGPIDPLLEGGDTSFERLPALESIFGQMAAEFSRRFSSIVETPFEFQNNRLVVQRVNEARIKFASFAISFAFHCPRQGIRLVVAVDHAFISSLFEILYGGPGCEHDIDADRSITRIDMAAAAFVMELLAGALSGALSVIMELDLQLEAIHPAFELSALGRQNSPAVICCCGLTTMGQSGSVIILLPRSMLDPFRALLSRNVSAESVAPDKQWSTLLHDCVVQTEIQISATMDR